MQEKQLPPAMVAAILAAGDIALLVLEIPTGWFADRFGHRASLILGSVVQVAAMFCCWLGTGIPELVAASLLVAVGDAFRSGADEALLFRSCVALGREDRFLAIASRSHTLEVCALVGLVAGGGVIATTWSFDAAWGGEIAMCAAGAACALAMSEPPPALNRTAAVGQADAAPLAWAQFAPTIVPVAFLGGAASAGSFLAQTSGGGSTTELTVLVAVITAAEAAGAALAPRIPASGVRGQLILGACGVLLIGAGVAAPITFYAAVVGLAFLEGMGEPLRAVSIQQATRDGMRARAASAANACDMLFSTLALPLAGMWVKQ